MAQLCGKLLFEKNCFSNEITSEQSSKLAKHDRLITDHHFNQSINLCLPDCSAAPDDLLALISHNKFCLVENLPLSELVREEFIEAFIKKGRIYMLSQNTKIDTDDCAALLPTGELILNLTKDTYVGLGLEGTVSTFHEKHKDKYVVVVPLTAEFFKPGKKYFERVKWCFEKQSDLKFTFTTIWEPKDVSISSTSLGNYFRKHRDLVCHECLSKASRKSQRYCNIPHIKHNTLQETEENCDYQQFYEWLGAVTLGISCDGDPESYVNTFNCPEPNSRHRDNMTYSFMGFFSTETIRSLVNCLRVHVKSVDACVPWAAITVHGSHDSPVTWRSQQHGYHTSGDNSYTLVVFPGDKYWLYKSYGPLDIYL